MHHDKYDYIKTIVASNIKPVLLTGTAGTGKTTIIMQIAEELGYTFSSISCTKQMSVNALLGFRSITGTYVGTPFRDIFQHGGVFLLDEIDAADPNVLLALNTIENGFIAFPDGIVKAHSDFRLCATANPVDQHNIYTGRSKLDFSTLDRFYHIDIPRDNALEQSLTSKELFEEIQLARSTLVELGMSKEITMRDAILMHKLSALNLTECVFKDVVFKDDTYSYKVFASKREKNVAKRILYSKKQRDAESLDELWDIGVAQHATHLTENPVVTEMYENEIPF